MVQMLGASGSACMSAYGRGEGQSRGSCRRAASVICFCQHRLSEQNGNLRLEMRTLTVLKSGSEQEGLVGTGSPVCGGGSKMAPVC